MSRARHGRGTITRGEVAGCFVVHRLRPEPCGLAEQPGRLAHQLDELLDHHGLVGDFTLMNDVAVGGQRDGDDPGHVGAETVGALAQLHRFHEGFVGLPVEPGA